MKDSQKGKNENCKWKLDPLSGSLYKCCCEENKALREEISALRGLGSGDSATREKARLALSQIAKE